MKSSINDLITNIADLGKLTTLGIGGACSMFAEPKTEAELSEILKYARANNLCTKLLGGGSNLLISDETIDALVIKLSGSEFGEIAVDENRMRCGAGATLASVINTACENNLSGLETFIGIPGTIGGAAFMNAGSKNFWLSELIESLDVYDKDGKRFALNKSDINFGYRQSNLSDYVITGINLKLATGDKDTIRKIMREKLEKKNSSQPLGQKSAGCVYKNPEGFSAGELIDRAGLKGFCIGDAQVSEKHANYIINKGGASFNDYLSLVNAIIEKVKSETGITLEPEIKTWT